MDFHSLPRKELQVLCKKNKIPANLTNVAMADALLALHVVEGVKELQGAASGILSPPKVEEPKPVVPPPQPASRKVTRRTATAVGVGPALEEHLQQEASPRKVVAEPQPASRRPATRRNATTDASDSVVSEEPPSPPPYASLGRRVTRSARASSRVKPKNTPEEKQIDGIPLIEIPDTPATAAVKTRTRLVAKTPAVPMEPEMDDDEEQSENEAQPKDKEDHLNLPTATPAVCTTAPAPRTGRRVSTRTAAAAQQPRVPLAPEPDPEPLVNNRTRQSSRRPRASSRARSVPKMVDLVPDPDKGDQKTEEGEIETQIEQPADLNVPAAPMNQKEGKESSDYVITHEEISSKDSEPSKEVGFHKDEANSSSEECVYAVEMETNTHVQVAVQAAANVARRGRRASRQQPDARRCNRTSQTSRPPGGTSSTTVTTRTTRSRSRGARQTDAADKQHDEDDVALEAAQSADAQTTVLVADSPALVEQETHPMESEPSTGTVAASLVEDEAVHEEDQDKSTGVAVQLDETSDALNSEEVRSAVTALVEGAVRSCEPECAGVVEEETDASYFSEVTDHTAECITDQLSPNNGDTVNALEIEDKCEEEQQISSGGHITSPVSTDDDASPSLKPEVDQVTEEQQQPPSTPDDGATVNTLEMEDKCEEKQQLSSGCNITSPISADDDASLSLKPEVDQVPEEQQQPPSTVASVSSPHTSRKASAARPSTSVSKSAISVGLVGEEQLLLLSPMVIEAQPEETTNDRTRQSSIVVAAPESGMKRTRSRGRVVSKMEVLLAPKNTEVISSMFHESMVAAEEALIDAALPLNAEFEYDNPINMPLSSPDQKSVSEMEETHFHGAGEETESEDDITVVALENVVEESYATDIDTVLDGRLTDQIAGDDGASARALAMTAEQPPSTPVAVSAPLQAGSAARTFSIRTVRRNSDCSTQYASESVLRSSRSRVRSKAEPRLIPQEYQFESSGESFVLCETVVAGEPLADAALPPSDVEEGSPINSLSSPVTVCGAPVDWVGVVDNETDNPVSCPISAPSSETNFVGTGITNPTPSHAVTPATEPNTATACRASAEIPEADESEKQPNTPFVVSAHRTARKASAVKTSTLLSGTTRISSRFSVQRDSASTARSTRSSSLAVSKIEDLLLTPETQLKEEGFAADTGPPSHAITPEAQPNSAPACRGSAEIPEADEAKQQPSYTPFVVSAHRAARKASAVKTSVLLSGGVGSRFSVQRDSASTARSMRSSSLAVPKIEDVLITQEPQLKEGLGDDYLSEISVLLQSVVADGPLVDGLSPATQVIEDDLIHMPSSPSQKRTEMDENLATEETYSAPDELVAEVEEEMDEAPAIVVETTAYSAPEDLVETNVVSSSDFIAEVAVEDAVINPPENINEGAHEEDDLIHMPSSPSQKRTEMDENLATQETYSVPEDLVAEVEEEMDESPAIVANSAPEDLVDLPEKETNDALQVVASSTSGEVEGLVNATMSADQNKETDVVSCGVFIAEVAVEDGVVIRGAHDEEQNQLPVNEDEKKHFAVDSPSFKTPAPALGLQPRCTPAAVSAPLTTPKASAARSPTTSIRKSVVSFRLQTPSGCWQSATPAPTPVLQQEQPPSTPAAVSVQLTTSKASSARLSSSVRKSVVSFRLAGEVQQRLQTPVVGQRMSTPAPTPVFRSQEQSLPTSAAVSAAQFKSPKASSARLSTSVRKSAVSIKRSAVQQRLQTPVVSEARQSCERTMRSSRRIAAAADSGAKSRGSMSRVVSKSTPKPLVNMVESSVLSKSVDAALSFSSPAQKNTDETEETTNDAGTGITKRVPNDHDMLVKLAEPLPSTPAIAAARASAARASPSVRKPATSTRRGRLLQTPSVAKARSEQRTSCRTWQRSSRASEQAKRPKGVSKMQGRETDGAAAESPGVHPGAALFESVNYENVEASSPDEITKLLDATAEVEESSMEVTDRPPVAESEEQAEEPEGIPPVAESKEQEEEPYFTAGESGEADDVSASCVQVNFSDLGDLLFDAPTGLSDDCFDKEEEEFNIEAIGGDKLNSEEEDPIAELLFPSPPTATTPDAINQTPSNVEKIEEYSAASSPVASPVAAFFLPSPLATTSKTLELFRVDVVSGVAALSTPDVTNQAPSNVEDASASPIAATSKQVPELFHVVAVSPVNERVDAGSCVAPPAPLETPLQPPSSSKKTSTVVTAKKTKTFTLADDKENSLVLLIADTTADNSSHASEANAGAGEDGQPDKKQQQKNSNKRPELPTREELLAMSMRQLKKQFAALTLGSKQNAAAADNGRDCPEKKKNHHRRNSSIGRSVLSPLNQNMLSPRH